MKIQIETVAVIDYSQLGINAPLPATTATWDFSKVISVGVNIQAQVPLIKSRTGLTSHDALFAQAVGVAEQLGHAAVLGAICELCDRKGGSGPG